MGLRPVTAALTRVQTDGLTARDNFTRKECFYSDLIMPTKTQGVWVFKQSAQYFYPL